MPLGIYLSQCKANYVRILEKVAGVFIIMILSISMRSKCIYFGCEWMTLVQY